MNDSNISETRCSRDDMTKVTVGDMTFSFSYCNDLPGLTDAEYYDLNEDIGMRGVQVAVIIDEHGAVLDGKHRVLSAAEHKLKTIPIEVKVGLTENEKQKLALDLNPKRRHLTAEQRKELVMKMRQKGMSFREIGEKMNMSASTIKADVDKATVRNRTVELPEKIKGKDGKVRPAKMKRKPSVMVKTVNEAMKATEAVQAAGADHFPAKMIDLKRASRSAREVKAVQRKTEAVEDLTFKDAKILHGEFQDRASEIADDSVGLIFTDPPYAKEFLPLSSDLGELAARV